MCLSNMHQAYPIPNANLKICDFELQAASLDAAILISQQ